MIKRYLYKALKRHSRKKEITLLVGPRQAGKTTLLKELEKELKLRGQRTVFLNLDFEEDAYHFKSQKQLIDKLKLEFGSKKGFCFIDEIQRKTDAGIFLKGIYDQDLPYKFIVSGSGSVELKEHIHESLMGRKKLFELSTISFFEWLDYKTKYKYSNRLQDFCKIESQETKLLLDEYLRFGGYPRVILEETIVEKASIINEIYKSYIEKDIAYLLKTEKLEAFGYLMRLLGDQTGKLINFSELSQTLGITFPTLKNYIWYAEKTFIIEQIKPFFQNLRKEITKSPIIYYCDLGLRNFAVSRFVKELTDSEKGFLFQNLFFNILKENYKAENCRIGFWRTKDGAEVDFVLEQGKIIIPIEVKYQNLKRIEVPRALYNFIKRYSPQKAYVINLNLEESVQIGDTEVRFLPFYNFINKD